MKSIITILRQYEVVDIKIKTQMHEIFTYVVKYRIVISINSFLRILALQFILGYICNC